MEIICLPRADDLSFWIAAGNSAILKKIADLTRSIFKSPFSGIGKPEPLKYNLGRLWSRRINSEHRYVYKVEEETLYVYSVKGHY